MRITDKTPSRSAGCAARRLAVAAVLLLAIVTAIGQSACFPFNIQIESRQTIIDPSFIERTTATAETTSAGTSATAESTSPPTPAATTETVPEATSATSAQESFESRTAKLILAGLQRRKTSISIDSAIEPRSIPESEIQNAIDLVFEVYQQIFLDHPEFFYLNGSINVSYSKESLNGYLVAMTIKPGYWDSMTGLADAELDSMIDQVEGRVASVAAEIRGETDVPWRQLMLIHDYLIRSIAYNTSLDQQTNHVYSALVNGTTLCQGYAQSFQLIAQRLGFETHMILGDADGVGHAWNIVKLNGKYYHVDVTFDDPTPDSGSNGLIQHIHFLRSDRRMDDSHTWITDDYPACPDDGADYYRRQGLTVDSQETLRAAIENFVASIDFNTSTTNRLELLFTGSTPPTESELEDMIRSALRSGASGYSVLFSNQISKRVVMVDITPD